MFPEESLPSSLSSPEDTYLEVTGIERWSIYNRLRSLDIHCQCQAGQPLKVSVNSPQDLVQCWSVARHSVGDTGSRSRVMAWLESCWIAKVRS